MTISRVRESFSRATAAEDSRHERPPTVLVIEPDHVFARHVVMGLEAEGFDAYAAQDGQDGLNQVYTRKPDVVVMNPRLAVKGGWDVCRELRRDSRTQTVPVLMMADHADEADHLIAFAVGADDFLVKPCSLKILAARLRYHLRRPPLRPIDEAVIDCHGLVVDRRRHQARYRDRDLKLTYTEFRLLLTLMQQPGRVFTREELKDAALGEQSTVLENTITAHIKSLRGKLDEVADFVETVRSLGYRFREPVSADY